MIKKDVNVNDLPSFNDIEDQGLRSHNRGAILANIYEIYKKSYDDLVYSLETYMERIPKQEKAAAENAMIWHLKQRGYTIGS